MGTEQIIIIGLILLGGAVFLFLFRVQSQLNEMSKRIPDVKDVENLAEKIRESEKLNRQSFERLSGTLGELSKSTENMIQIGKNIASLEDLLKPPKLRGGIGETMLEMLLAQILPQENYRLQLPFSSGVVVDAAILIGDRIVPVDSKFPLEQFRKLQVVDDKIQKGRERRHFIRTVKNHIDVISQKYILPDEGTYEFALMYIPAENVYYEAIIKDEFGEGLFPYSLEKRVIPVSPNSFYAYLQVIVYGLKGMRIEEQARAIMVHLSRLQSDEERVRAEFDVLGTHLRNARNKYDETDRLLSRFEDKLDALDVRKEIEKLPEK